MLVGLERRVGRGFMSISKFVYMRKDVLSCIYLSTISCVSEIGIHSANYRYPRIYLKHPQPT